MGLKEKEGTGKAIYTSSFSLLVLSAGTQWTLLHPLYAFPGLRIRRASEKAAYIRSQPWGAHCCVVRYHLLSFLQCHSRAKELCVVFAQLRHLYLTMTSVFLTKCAIKKSLRFPCECQCFHIHLATWTSSVPVSWRSSRLGSPIFLDNCVR